MSRTPDPPGGTTSPSPHWVSGTLVVGAAVMVGWAWFLHGFLSEPSATGRVRLLLVSWAAFSVLAALLGLVAAVAAMRAAPWSRRIATVAGAAMTITVVGAIAGVPALLGIVWSRSPGSNSPKLS